MRCAGSNSVWFKTTRGHSAAQRTRADAARRRNLPARLILLLTACLWTIMSCADPPSRLTFWVGGAPQEIDFWEELVHEFEIRTGLSVDVIRQPAASGQRKQGLVLALASRRPDPDLFLMDIVWVSQFVRSEWLARLNGYFQDDTLQPRDFFPRVIDAVDRYGEDYYALPAFLDVGVLYYRTDLLQRYGFDRPPETWQDLLRQSLHIQQAERGSHPQFNGFVWQGAQYEGLVCTFLEFAVTHGGGFMRDGRLDLAQAENAAALQFMQDLIQRHAVSPRNTYTEMQEEEVRQAFQRGNALFERNWLYAWRLHQRDGSAVQGKVGLSALPHVPGAPTAAALGGWHLGISRYSDAGQDAWRLAAFLLSKETQKKILLQLGWYSCRRDLYTDPEVRAKVPRIDALETIVAHAVSRPNRPYYGHVSGIIQRYANECLSGKRDARTALVRMQKEIEEMERYYE